MKYITLILLLVFNYLNCKGQLENSNWLFPPRTLVHFKSGVPVVSTVPNNFTNRNSNTSVVSDSQGELLFYTQGVLVYDKNHNLMPNSAEDFAGINCRTIKLSAAENQYAIVTQTFDDVSIGLYAQIVDMTLNNGLGNIIEGSQIHLGDNYSNLISVFSHPCEGYWVTVHKMDTNSFESFHLIGTSVQRRTTSIIGNAYTLPNRGSINVTSKFDLIYTDGVGVFEIFKFNPITGQITNPTTIYTGEGGFFIQSVLSPDERFIYTYGSQNTILSLRQFDISSNDPTTIMLSDVKLASFPDCGGGSVGIATDQKIYFTCLGNNYSLGVINSPNLQGLNCNFVDSSLIVPDWFASIGFPMPLVFENSMDIDFLPQDTSSCGNLSLTIKPSISFDSILWSTGQSDPEIEIKETGLYEAEIFRGACSFIDSVWVEITHEEKDLEVEICGGTSYLYKGKMYKIGETIQDTLLGEVGSCDTLLTISILSAAPVKEVANLAVCEGETHLGPDGSEYSIGDTLYIQKQGADGQCDTLLSLAIVALPLPQPTISGQEIICFSTKTDLTASSHNSYLWNTGATTSSIQVGGGSYDVTVLDSMDCEASASILIIERPVWMIDILDSLTIEVGINYTLQLTGHDDRIDSWFITPQTEHFSLQRGSIDILGSVPSGLYTLVFSDNIGCMVEHQLHIDVKETPDIVSPNIFSPSAFLPENRLWKVNLRNNLSLIEASIYDRWGNQVFVTKDIQIGWDGKSTGKSVVSGVYIYHITAMDSEGLTIIKSGDLLVIE